MVSERALMEGELSDLIEGEFSLPVIIRLGGKTYATSQNDPTQPLVGMVLYDARRETLTDSGMPIIIKEMVVTLRRTSCPPGLLNPVPGTKAEILIPQDPVVGSPMVSYMLDGSKAPDEGRTLGTIRLYPKRARQS